MKFILGTASNSLNMTEDLKLIKSSLLYADEIELIGMLEYAIYKYLPNISNGEDLEALLENLKPFINSVDIDGKEGLLQQLDTISYQLHVYSPSLKRKKHRTRQEIIAQFQLKNLEKQFRESLTSEFNLLSMQPGVKEIKSLIDNNIISVFDYGFSKFDVDELCGGYFGNLMNAMHNGYAYPLFDKISSDLVQSVVRTNILDISELDDEVLRHAGVASKILMTLPTLESASVDELLSLKRENEKPLVNFRKAIYDFSGKIHSLPWDKNFQYDCIKLYNSEVLPEIQEINEIMTQTCTLKNLGSKAIADEEVRKGAGFAVAGLTTAITTSSNMFNVLIILKQILLTAGMVGISTAAAMSFLKICDLYHQEKKEIKEKKDEASTNVMYYYYLASTIK